MAHVQALTHFVARALDELHVAESELATVSYKELMKARIWSAKIRGNFFRRFKMAIRLPKQNADHSLKNCSKLKAALTNNLIITTLYGDFLN